MSLSDHSEAQGDSSPGTIDDRCFLLPKEDSKTRAVPAQCEDSQVKPSIVDLSHEVYTITDQSLPSHMRSLLPTHERQVHDLLSLERTRRRLRYVIICLSVLLALTVLLAVVLVFALKVKPTLALVDGRSGKGLLSSFGSKKTVVSSTMRQEVKISLLGNERRSKFSGYRHKEADTHRTPCMKECWSYAAFRFRSVCNAGYCQCQGQDYDTDTCLPKYNHCQIKRRSASKTLVRLFGRNQTTYSCSSPVSHPESVHVVSIFGNHQSPTTHVTIRNQSASSKVLVLVNYHYVSWTVHLPEQSGISKIVLVSMKRFHPPEHVVFSPDSPVEKPEVVQRLSLTGYGQDKHGGHTPQLLKFVEEEIGPISSFLGCSHADDITLEWEGDITTSMTPNVTSHETP